MAKNVHNNVLDAALNYLNSNANRLVVLSAEPTGASAYTNAQTDFDSSGYRLAEATISASDFTGPADGDTSGRKIQVNAQSSMSINGVTSSANATHVALVKQSSTASSQMVLYTTTCTSQSLTGGNQGNQKGEPTKLSSIRQPGERIYLADNEAGNWRPVITDEDELNVASRFNLLDVWSATHLPASDQTSTGSNLVRRVSQDRHRNKGCNNLFFDGHSDWLSKDDNTTLYWCGIELR